MDRKYWDIHTLYCDIADLASGELPPDEKSDISARARTTAQALHLLEVERRLRNDAYEEALTLLKLEWGYGEFTPCYTDCALPRNMNSS